MRRLTDGVLSHLDGVLAAGDDSTSESSEGEDEAFADAMTRHTMSTPLAVVAGRFQIHGVLGRGGMSEVYRASDMTSGREVALKVQHAGEAWLDARFDREARTLKELTHPSLVAYVAHGRTEDNLLWLATELVVGPTLAEDLEQRARRRVPHTWEQVAGIARDIGGALGTLHDRGLVHRDVKPSNIVMASHGPARLLDLGLLGVGPEGELDHASAHGVGLTQTGALLGTVGYLAPEQARRDRGIGPAADVFALGCVVFECIAGAPPFGTTLTEVTAAFAMGCHVPVERLPADVPSDLRAFVLDALQEDPAARPASGREVAARFASLSTSTEAAAPASIDDLMSSTIGLDASARRAPALPFVTSRRVEPPAATPGQPVATGTVSMLAVDPARLPSLKRPAAELELLWFDREAWTTGGAALEVLASTKPSTREQNSQALREGLQRGVRCTALVAGNLELVLDASEALRATLGAITPYLRADGPLKDAYEAAAQALSTASASSQRIAASHKQRIDELLAQRTRNRAAIDALVEQAVVETRSLARRPVFGASHWKASLDGIATYLPEAAGWELPLLRSFEARVWVELRPAQESDDGQAISYRVRAIARVV